MSTVLLTTEQAARQLLEIAEGIQHGTDWNNGTHAKIYRPKFPEAITALREALAEQAEQEPYRWILRLDNGVELVTSEKPDDDEVTFRKTMGDTYVEVYAAPVKQAEQEPVAYLRMGSDQRFVVTKAAEELLEDTFHELYTHPVRTKDLTDDEIDRIWLKMPEKDEFEDVHWFARAVIAKDREKNK